MKRIALALMCSTIVVPLLQGIAAAAPPGSATPQMRTYVSGMGNDTASSPCKTFQAALALTLHGGEIYVLNSANYGAVTINKAVTITSEGAVAGVLATSGPGITINAGANDVINLRGLCIDGANTGIVGIQLNSGGSLNVQKSSIRNFASSGIIFGPASGTSVFLVPDSEVSNNGKNGILVAPSGSGAVNGVLNRVVVPGNGLASSGVGLFAYGRSSTGAVNVTITDTVANNNYYGIGVGGSAVMVRNSTVSHNLVGIRADQAAIVPVSQATVIGNGTGWQPTNGGLLQSYGNNNASGNGTDGTLTSTVALQ
jgi:hypothetical protein